MRRYARSTVRRVRVEESRYAHLLTVTIQSDSMHADRQEYNQHSLTYVQGMKVLAAPFLYTMPSELEAFFSFAKFIEGSPPVPKNTLRKATGKTSMASSYHAVRTSVPQYFPGQASMI